MGIESIPLSGALLPESVARHLLDRHANLLPDLSGLIVLVPNHRAGQDFARALAREAHLPAMIPPFITPLKAWAETAADVETETSSQRLARLHGELRKQKWLGDVDRWALAEELLQLADELSAARLGGEIASRIRALRGIGLDRETALIEAIWQALNTSGTDPQARYARALDVLVRQAADTHPRPVFGYSLGPLTALEKNFLENYAKHAPVHLYEANLHPGDGVVATFHAAWFSHDADIKTRAFDLASAFPEPPLRGLTKLCPAPHLEAEARAVTAWVAEQLQAGRRSIALIALDRETARRVRALLERVDVLVADETGWTLSTTAAAAVIDRWMECVARDFPHVDLLDLLKSPFVLSDAAMRQDDVMAFEIAMRQHGVSQSMVDLRRLAQNHVLAALPWLDTLADAARTFAQSRTTLSTWLTRLAGSLDKLNAISPLNADAAGANVLDTIERLRRELATDTEKYSFSEWRCWLNRELENASFIDESVDSPIVLTSLPAARGRVFEAVAVLGTDATKLPGGPSAGLFSQTTRAQLGLPTFAEQAEQASEDIIRLLALGPALLSWQAWHEDEPNPASPLVIRLQVMHRAAWGCELEIQHTAEPPARESPLPALSQKPAPAIEPERLPRRFSPSTYQTLIDCPYRFFAKSVLGLKELEKADEALDKSDYGTALHNILKRFHDAGPPFEREAALKLLAGYSEAEFSDLPAYTAAAWRARWAAIQPAYIDTWLAHEADGWHYQSGETDVEIQHAVPGLGDVTLHGRVDRIDRRIDPSGGDTLYVVDYKTSSAANLNRKLKDPGEAVQLPFYAWLCEAAAAFLPIDDDPVLPLALDGETNVEAISLRLSKLLEAIAQGARLPADGVDAVCNHCEARGLCRKGAWDE